MELFKNAKVVRLRSHHDKYLLANEDEEHVLQDRNGSADNARWTVELKENNENVLRLKSCYGCYLTASNEPCLLGVTGRKVLQTVPPPLDSSVDWEPARDGFQVRLKTCYGQFLRANGGLPPWRNSITHDITHHAATHDWVLWEVDILEHHPPPSLDPEPTTPHRTDGRLIYYVVAEDDAGGESSSSELSFSFKGTTVGQLTEKLKEVTGIEEHIFVCSRSPLNGSLCPLHLHLPPNNATMHVVVVPDSSAVAKSLV